MNTSPITLGTPVISSPLTLGMAPAPAAAPAGGNALISTGYSAVPAQNYAPGNGMVQAAAAAQTPYTNPVSGGGALSDAFATGFQKIADFAARGMKGVQDAIDGQMSAKGEVDASSLQKATMEMSKFENLMMLAKKIQDSQNQAIQIWLRGN